MDPRKWTRNREIKFWRTQIRGRKHQNLRVYNTKRTPNEKRENKENVLSHETKLECCPRNRLSKSDKMRNKQYSNNKTLRITKEIRTSISVKENKTFIKKRESKLRYSSKRIEIKTFILNIYKTRETTIYKELSRRLTL